jgi:hypothetical protein
MHSIPPKIGELFHALVLFQHRAAFGFEGLRTIRGWVYTTCQEAATVLGLFEDELGATYAMREVMATHSCPGQLRFLFARLIPGLLTPATTLWENF